MGHVEIPAGADHLPRNPVGLAALATRRHRLAYRQTPVVQAIAERAPDPRDFDLIIANDLITVPVVLDLAGSTPVIADMHATRGTQCWATSRVPSPSSSIPSAAAIPT